MHNYTALIRIAIRKFPVRIDFLIPKNKGFLVVHLPNIVEDMQVVVNHNFAFESWVLHAVANFTLQPAGFTIHTLTAR